MCATWDTPLAMVPNVPKRLRYADDATNAGRLKPDVCAGKSSKYL